jgi:outer membrane receptor for ferrienterochelin and colicins
MKIKYAFIFLILIGFRFELFAQDTIAAPFTSISFKVFGACEQCKDRIEIALKIKGVKTADWNVDTKQLALEYNPAVISLEKIENKIVAIGHDLVNKKAKNVIYKSLPSCCLYRDLVPEINTAASIDSIKNIVAPININNPSYIKGIVLQETNTGKLNPLFNASIYWLGTNTGVFTDSVGVFSIKPSTNSTKLVISYIGYKSDTIDVASNNELKIFLASKKQLSEITVFSKQKTSYFSPLATIRTEVMTSGELLKAACCNLSESFETNPSVDVSYNDAVTGSKQIQLLGLSGNYTQLTVENLPGPRGLATPLGLNSIAGPWIESIQLTKGVGSVANGFESIAGQINVELKKPETAEQLLANIYINELGKTDLNLNLSKKLSSKWSSGLLLHEDFLNNSQLDFNKDGFRDLPTGNQFSLVNRYKYDNNKGLLSQFGIKIFKDDRVGGQTSFNEKTDINSTFKYGLGINTQRYEAFGKIGYVFPQQKYKSIGIQLAAIDYTQNSYFGFTNYNSKQQSFYSNLIYQSIINSTIHKFRTGLSLQYDHYNEAIKLLNYIRKELVAGGFFEYTFTPTENFSLVAGIRADNNNLYGAFLTPRLNLRYEPIKGTIIRTSAGRGQRTATIFAENNSVFVSARQVSIISNNSNNAYGLNPEVSWNKGISIEQQFKLFQNNATLSFDYFRNDFTNQVVVDLENAREVKFYNLLGKSYSNSFQVELTSQLVSKIDVRLAYRYFDVKQTYSGQLLDKPFVAKNRAFLNLDYATVNGWKFNYTITYNGKKRLPNTNANPAAFQLPSYSPEYFLMNMQVTKKFNKKMPMEGYIGIENATNYFQQNAIISAAQPFSQYFDASMIWGPITGRMLYFGWRLKIN